MDCARKLQSAATFQLNTSSEEKRRQDAIERRKDLVGVVAADLLLLPLTEQDARDKNKRHYFNGLPCQKGHLDRRSVDGGCMECKRIDSADRRATPEGKEKVRAYSKQRWADPQARAKAQAQRAAWAQTPEGQKSLQRSYKSFYDNHRDRLVKENAQRSVRRYKNDPVYRMRQLVARRISLALSDKDVTKDETTFKLVGCSVDELVRHFENQFEHWMSWENMGEWHIDHVRPCASFDLSEREQQMTCFNWRNLQPLHGDENYLKKDAYSPTDETFWVNRMHALGFEGNLFLVYGTDG